MALVGYVHPRSYIKEVIADTPLSFWPCDVAGASTNVADHTKLHAGTATGDGVTYQQGGPGKGLDWAIGLAGTDDGILVGDFADYEFAGDFTAECWFKQTVGQAAQLIGKRQSAAGEWRMNVGASGAVGALLTNTASGNYLSVPGAVDSPMNVWHHAAMTVAGTTLTVYVDGAQTLQTSSVTGTRRTSSTDAFAFGFNGDTTTLELGGQMTAVAVYASALPVVRLIEHIKAAML